MYCQQPPLSILHLEQVFYRTTWNTSNKTWVKCLKSVIIRSVRKKINALFITYNRPAVFYHQYTIYLHSPDDWGFWWEVHVLLWWCLIIRLHKPLTTTNKHCQFNGNSLIFFFITSGEKLYDNECKIFFAKHYWSMRFKDWRLEL